MSQRTSFFYDAADQRIGVRDGNTNLTTMLYDAVGRAQATIDARGYRTSSVFDAAARRIALIDGNSRRTSFAFDNADRLTVTKDPLLRRTTQAYDAAGRQTVRIDANSIRITSTYDAADRLTVQRYASRRNTMAYDAVGNRTRLADATGVYTTVYDAKNRVTRTSNADGKRVTYTLDALDRRTRLINPDGGRTSSVYDANDRLIGLINPQTKRTSFAYDAIDRRVRQKHGNASLTTQLYDDANQLTGLINAKSTGTLVNRFTYSYDNAGNRTLVKESSGDRTSFSYDKTYQLTRERKSGAVTYDVTYTYDPVGNRLVQNDSGTRTTMAYDAANQVLTEQTGANRTTYTHDNRGNRTRKDAPAALTVYRWDDDNKPTSIHPPSNALTLTYNADGRRIKKVNPTQTRKFIYDWEKVLQETDGADVTTTGYTSTNEQYGELVSAYDGTNTRYFQDDALGSTDALLDDAETVNDRYRYRAFGLDSHYQGSATNPYTFVGQAGYYRDNEIDSYFVGARYYDYNLGRWISQDPLGFLDGANQYLYVRNNPISFYDPSGFVTLKECQDAVKKFKEDPWYKELKKAFENKKCTIAEPECATNKDEDCATEGFAGGHATRGEKAIIKICYERASTESLPFTIRHEFIHDLDRCLGRFKGFEVRALSACSELRAYMCSGQCITPVKKGGRLEPGKTFEECILAGAIASIGGSYGETYFKEFEAEGFVCCVWKECTRLFDIPVDVSKFQPKREAGPLKRPKVCDEHDRLCGVFIPQPVKFGK